MTSSSESNPAPEMVAVGASLDDLRLAAEECTACELCTGKPLGSSSVGAGVGVAHAGREQPGDAEALEGEPFVGPAGLVLDEALANAGIPAGSCYVTNVVKHLRWKPQGGRRLRQSPATRHVRACLPWLEAELEMVAPAVSCVSGRSPLRRCWASRSG